MKNMLLFICLFGMAPLAQAQEAVRLRDGFYKPDHLAKGPLCNHRITTVRNDFNQMVGLTITFAQPCGMPPEIYDCKGKFCMFDRAKGKKAAEDKSVYYLYLYNETSYQRNVQTNDGTPGITQNYDWYMGLNGQ